ncbi:MAG: UbiD family decarboxylase [Deltaproteobacteria bacterium]|nr:UbiD family decarboxylase [Deltaproteobacteria bacterium]
MSTLRQFLDQASADGLVVDSNEPIGRTKPLASVLSRESDQVHLHRVEGYDGRLVSGLVSSRRLAARALGVEPAALLDSLSRLLAGSGSVRVVDRAPFEEHVVERPDLGTSLPLQPFYPGDGGPYATAFVVAARSSVTGQNLSFHRMMYLGKNRFAVRVVRRHLHAILAEGQGKAQVAVFCGVHPAVLLAAAVSAAPDMDELRLAANMLGGLDVFEVLPELFVPAHAEIVLTGSFTGELVDEGPFVDLTGTYDGVRRQPVFEVDRLWMRSDPIYHAIVPAGPEHKVLMGLPREAALLRAARSACPTVEDAVLTAGGSGWLHAVVSVRDSGPGQAVNIGTAVLAAHQSLKRVVVVDHDIDILAQQDVEWALATRVQPDRDIVILDPARGSSLDPSRRKDGTTSKWIVDATIPAGADRSEFLRADAQGDAQGEAQGDVRDNARGDVSGGLDQTQRGR